MQPIIKCVFPENFWKGALPPFFWGGGGGWATQNFFQETILQGSSLRGLGGVLAGEGWGWSGGEGGGAIPESINGLKQTKLHLNQCCLLLLCENPWMTQCLGLQVWPASLFGPQPKCNQSSYVLLVSETRLNKRSLQRIGLQSTTKV